MSPEHPTQPLVLQAAIRVLREHAEGRSVDPSRLDWAVTMALQNPQRISIPSPQTKEAAA